MIAPEKGKWKWPIERCLFPTQDTTGRRSRANSEKESEQESMPAVAYAVTRSSNVATTLSGGLPRAGRSGRSVRRMPPKRSPMQNSPMRLSQDSLTCEADKASDVTLLLQAAGRALERRAQEISGAAEAAEKAAAALNAESAEALPAQEAPDVAQAGKVVAATAAAAVEKPAADGENVSFAIGSTVANFFSIN